MALDLPVKTLNGTKYYYYKVKKNESVYGLSKKLGMSRDEIVRHNPAAADGIKKGMTLYFPYDEYATKSEPKAAVEEQIDTVAVDTASDKASSIVLMLPFGPENKEQSRRNKLALDFYKGFLMAADTLASRNGLVEIHAIDIDVENSRFDAILRDEAVTNASVIVAPDNGAAYRKIAKTARENGNYVLNVFLVADSLYTENPNVLRANIPHLDMYRLAVDAFESDFKDYTPVILRNRTGRNEKRGFCVLFYGALLAARHSTNRDKLRKQPCQRRPQKPCHQRRSTLCVRAIVGLDDRVQQIRLRDKSHTRPRRRERQ